MRITKGKDLIIVASGGGDLSFRIFKYDGEREDVVAPVEGMLQSRCFASDGKPVEKNELGRAGDAGESPAYRWSQEETGDIRRDWGLAMAHPREKRQASPRSNQSPV